MKGCSTCERMQKQLAKYDNDFMIEFRAETYINVYTKLKQHCFWEAGTNVVLRFCPECGASITRRLRQWRKEGGRKDVEQKKA